MSGDVQRWGFVASFDYNGDTVRSFEPSIRGDFVLASDHDAAVRAARDEALSADFLDKQAAWSRNTFGPGDRLDGVLGHIGKEIEEARAKPGDVSEWADIAILAFDGAQRQGFTGQQFIDAWRAKVAKNQSRTWPDWRTAEPGKAIEHVRSTDSDPECAVCGRDNRNGTHDALETFGHLNHGFTALRKPVDGGR